MEGLSTTTEKTEPRNKFYTTILLVALCFNTGCDYFNEEPQDFNTVKKENIEKIENLQGKNNEKIKKKESKIEVLQNEIKELKEKNKDLDKKMATRPSTSN